MRGTHPIAKYEVFGWVVHHMGMEPGKSYRAFISPGMTRASFPSRTLWTRGRVVGKSDTGILAEDRVPGLFTLDMPDPVPGNYTFEALDHTEWWCIDRKFNQGQIPEVTPLRVKVGELVQLPAGTRLLVCSGRGTLSGTSVAPGFSIETSEEATLHATEGILAMTFDRSKE